jgi:hypothetical protein
MSSNIGTWPKKKDRETKPVLRICKIHGKLVFEGQICRNKVDGKIYYTCKACKTIKRRENKVSDSYLSKIK